MSFLLTIFLIWSLAVIAPGPNIFLVMRYALSGQSSRAFFAACGIASGTFLWGMAGSFGINMLFAAAPYFYTGLKLIGAAYLSWIGVKLLIAAKCNQYVCEPTMTEAKGKAFASYWVGLATSLSNPKTALVVSALFATSLPKDVSLLHGLCGAGLMALISVSWYAFAGFILSSGPVSRLFLKARRFIDAFAGLAFLGFAGKLITSKS